MPEPAAGAPATGPDRAVTPDRAGIPDRAGDHAGAGRRGRRPWTLQARLSLLLAVSGVMLALGLGAIVVSQARLAATRGPLIEEIDPAVVAAHDLRSALIDQETGIRGYALTGDRSFLAPYERGQAAEREQVAQLHELLGAHAGVQTELRALTEAVARWRAETAEPTIAAIDRGEGSEVSGGAFQSSARTRFDELRSLVGDLEQELTRERDRRREDLAGTAQVHAWAAVGLGAAMVLVGSVVPVALRRSVTAPVEQLTEDVRRVAEGDLHRPVRAEGAAELVHLAADVDAMRRRILDEVASLREASAAIERQAEELARSNADLEQFAYVASHDLQEPLRKVAGFCQLLQRRYEGQLDERADEYIRYAVDGAQRMQQLINDLLAFSRVGRTTERFEPISLEAAAGGARENLAVAIEDAGATVTIGALPTVPGDARLLTTLFQNLMANGLKFHRPGEPPRVEIGAELSAGADEVTITVRDHGIGIEDQYADQIFTLFKRLHTRTEYEGTGIGLALCKRIVEFHDGRIWLAATGGEGATFRLTLPIHKETPP